MEMRMDLETNQDTRVTAKENYRAMSIQYEKDSQDFEKVKSSIIRKEEVYNPDPDLYFNS